MLLPRHCPPPERIPRMSGNSLFDPLQLGPFTLSHRVVMAPLTRMRTTRPGNVPNEHNARYYDPRASQGDLIIDEASQVNPSGQGSLATPGYPSVAQVESWMGDE